MPASANPTLDVPNARTANGRERHPRFASAHDRLRIVHSESSLGWGGQEIRILSESVGLRERGHDVRLVCPAEAPIFRAAQERGLPVTALPIARRNGRGLLAAAKWLRQNPVDAINTHSSTDSWLFSLAARTLRRRPGIVRTRHISAEIARDPFTFWIYARGADRLVTTGARLREHYLQRNGFSPGHVVSVPTGIDASRFAPGDRQRARAALGLPSHGLVLGIAATIRSWKGHRYLIDAVSLLPNRNELLVLVVGDGPSRGLVEERIAERGLRDRVVMAGQQPDVAPWLRAMDVFVLPSSANEGVPQSIVQAMCCGLPVISTPVGSIDEAVTHEQTGLLVPPQDAAALAQAIARLAADPALRQRLGQAGRRAAAARFALSHMLDCMEEIFYCAARR